MKHYSGKALTKTSVIFSLSALLCIPACGYAENAEAKEMAVQVVQQSRTVKGIITDETGEPMIGVTVRVKGSKTAAVTDMDGKFSIAAGAGDQLEVSYIGYATQTVSASNTQLNIQMKPDSATELDDVVVIGYGTMKRRDLTGAVTSVKAEDITMTPASNPIEALQGKVAGLDITKSSGQAGASISMQLRGTRSFTASGDPTVIIDGMPGNLSTINANDIESIEVLKDASSTAVYGSAGANGVIIVTTKSGKEGKAKVNFNAYVGINGWAEVPEVYDAQGFFNLRKQAQIESGAYIDDASVLGNAAMWEAYQRGESINWADEILKTGLIQNYSVSISGGTEKTKAYMSLNFTDEQGQYRDDNYKVYSTNMRIDHEVNKWLTAGINLQGSYTYKNSAYASLNYGLRQNPIGSIYDDEGNMNIETIKGTNLINVLVNNKSNYRNNNQVTRIYLNPYIRVTPLKGLTWESRINASLIANKKNQFEGIGSYNYYREGANVTGTNSRVFAAITQTNDTNYKWENILTYNFNIADKHDFTITGVTSWNHNRQEYTYSYADNLPSNAYLWHNLESGHNQQVQSQYTMSKGFGLVGRVNYSYMGKYLASASVRYDGSSRLAKGNQWDTFPAFSLGWRISEEKFMESTRSWLDNLKLRGGWGVTGTAAIDEYSSMSVLEQTNYGLGGVLIPAYQYSKNVANVNLGWEKSKNTNIGLDASFLNGRIDMALDYYFTKTEDVIWSKALPATGGMYDASTSFQTNMNICETETQGVELALNTRNITTKDFTWTSNLTFTYNKEKITKLATGAEYVSNGDDGKVLYMGEAINSWYNYKLNGVWKTSEAADAAVFGMKPGDLKIEIPGMTHVSEGVYQKYVEDENGNMVLKTYTAENPYAPSSNDYQVLGHQNPDWTMGFKNTFTYKGFDLSIYMYWRWGQTIYYETLGEYDPTGGTNNNFPTYFDYWTQETGNQDHYFPALNSASGRNNILGFGALNYVDGSFFKIKNITLGYTLPQKWAKKAGIESLRVYGTITNPLIIQKSDLLKDYDPEMGGTMDYPLTKQLVFGVNLTF